ncbi:hypothetical protein BX666DRAFT_1934709 [Dichotomocladium elegans]|nr:hypothetical protein BX666DRAFT_1934709 [Dichotomocladium elegans]
MSVDPSSSPLLPTILPSTSASSTISPARSNAHSRSRHYHSRSQQLSSPQVPLKHQRHHHHSLSIGSAASFFSEYSLSPVSLPPKLPATAISIEFDSSDQQQGVLVLRPNQYVQGRVILHVHERLYVTRIRIKFYAEEVATVKLDDGSSHQAVTTFFETDHTLWGDSVKTWMQSPWEELGVGDHEFPFEMKFPNVNYPPSIADPPGFAVHYIWTAHVDGPAGQADLNSRKYITPYRPIVVSTPDKEWVFRAVLTRDTSHKKQIQIAQVQARLNRQCYCPGQLLEIQLSATSLQPNHKIVQIRCYFRQHHQGRLATQRGLATSMRTHELYGTSLIEIQSEDEHAHFQSTTKIYASRFTVPTLNVSPTFASRHIRTTYDLLLQVTCEETQFLKRTNTTESELTIPVQLATMANGEAPSGIDLSQIEHYTKSKMMPIFLHKSSNGDCVNARPPPGYYDSCYQNDPYQWRQERTVYMVTPFTERTSNPGHVGCSSSSNNGSSVTGKSTKDTSSLQQSSRQSDQAKFGSFIPGCSAALAHHRRAMSLSDIGEALVLSHLSADEWA